MTELDHILLEQLHSAQRRMSRLRRMRMWMHDPRLNIAEHACHGHIQFFESMIQDKTLIRKRKKKRKKEEDVLYRHPVVMYYRNTYMFVKLSYRMLSEYLSLWSKKEKQ